MSIPDLVSSENPIIAEHAQKASQLRAALDRGVISEDEYNELKEDLIILANIDAATHNMLEQQDVQQALNFIKSFLTLI